MLCEYLRRNGYAAAEAANGHEALRQLDEVPHLCLILLDLMMPIMNGWQFRAEQRAHSRFGDVPVVILTAHPASVMDPSSVGIAGVLTKPVELIDILKVVQTYC